MEDATRRNAILCGEVIMNDNVKLKGKKVSYIEVEYGDFEALVMETYDLDEWSFVADIECGNDSSHDFTIDEDDTVSPWDKDKIRKFIESNGTTGYMTQALLADMHNKGLISPGNYLIQVCW